MAMDGTEIERLLKQAFPDSEVVVVDLRGDGDHYGARVTSGAFVGKSRIQQHKMVYDALQGQMGGALHALALETAVPSQTRDAGSGPDFATRPQIHSIS
jgi:stress-induced morphogen